MEFAIALAYNDPTEYAALARAADAAGFGAIILSDHIVYPEKLETPYPYTSSGRPRWDREAPWPDPWVAVGAMSSVTRRIRFLSSIFVLPLRDPVLAAKTIGTAAVMSGNRVTLGLGAGWMREEFDLVGQPFAQRGRRMEEMIEVMRALWTGEPVAHEGAFYSFPAMQMRPSPTEPIPIYIGGTSDVALRRAARIADGWASEVQNTEDVGEIQARLTEYRADSPLAAEPLETCVALRDAFTLDHYKRVQEMAITTLITVPWLLHGHTTPSLTQKQDSINRFANEVISHLT